MSAWALVVSARQLSAQQLGRRSNMGQHPIAEFEYTIEEALEAHSIARSASAELSSWRRHEQQRFFVAFILATTPFVGFLVWRSDRPPWFLLVAIGAVVVFGIGLAVPFGKYYDSVVRKRTRRLLVEQLGGEGPYHCAVEIRPDDLWVRQSPVAYGFPWPEATGICDRDDGVIVLFTGGVVYVRDRAFKTSDESSRFRAALESKLPVST